MVGDPHDRNFAPFGSRANEVTAAVRRRQIDVCVAFRETARGMTCGDCNTPPPIRVFESTVPFSALCAFSVEYMVEHAKDASSRQPDLLYLLDRYDGEFHHFLHYHGVPLASGPIKPEGSHTVYDQEGSWTGYPGDCPFGFGWSSCTSSILLAYKIADGSKNFRLECVPSMLRSECWFMRDLTRLGADWHPVPLRQIADRYGIPLSRVAERYESLQYLTEREGIAPVCQDIDVEPSSDARDMSELLRRPWSGC